MDREQVKRYSILEVTLLLVLLMGVGAAWLIVKAKSRVMLSDAIALAGSGVSVRVPSGAGWEHTPEWVYESDNSMALLAQGRVGRQTVIELRWRYTLSAPSKGLGEMLQERLAGTATITEPVEMPAGALMEAAQITAPVEAQQPTYYVAMAQLEHGRTIELQVIPKHSDYNPLYAEALLMDTALSLEYKTPEELGAGAALLERFFTTIEQSAPKEEAFLIKEGRGRTIGFFYAKYTAQTDAVRTIESQHFDAQQFMMESTLRVGRAGKPFTWETRLNVPMSTGLRHYEIQLDDQGQLNLTSNFEKEKALHVEEFILPELLLTDFARLLMESDRVSVVTDVLAATGAVVPVRVSLIEAQQAAASSDQIASAVRVEYLHAEGWFDEYYFDADGQAIGRFERQPRQPDRLWERTDLAALKQTFGDRLKVAAPATAAPIRYY